MMDALGGVCLVVFIIGAIGVWRTTRRIPTDKETRDYERKLQRKFAGRPVGPSGSSRS
jgi:hypothetical protein